MPYHVRTINSNTTLTSRDSTIEVDTTAGDVTITLNSGIDFYNQALANDGQGKIFTIKKSAGNNDVIVVVNAGGTIDGFSSLIITNLNDAVKVQADSPTSYISIGTHTASGTNYIGGGNFKDNGRIRFVTANYNATLNDDVIIVTPGGTDVVVTLPDCTTAYNPTGPTTGEGKKLTIVHNGTNVRRTRVQPFGGIPFVSENGHLIATGSRIDVQCISNVGPNEVAWLYERHDYSTIGTTSLGYTNVSNPAVAVPLNIIWNRNIRSMTIDYAPGTEPSVINISLGNGGNPVAPGGIDYNGQEFEIHIARRGATPINIDFGTASRNGLQGAVGIVPVTAGDFKHVKLHGTWSSGVSSTWLTSGDL